MFYFIIVNTLLVKSDYTGLVHRTGFGVTEDDEDSCSHKVIRIQKNLFQVLKIGAHQENTAQKLLRFTFTGLRNFYIYVSNYIMRGVIKGIGVQAKGNIYESSSDIGRGIRPLKITRRRHALIFSKLELMHRFFIWHFQWFAPTTRIYCHCN
jgi:hypothetical protein